MCKTEIITKLRIRTVSSALGGFEAVFFYPKLKRLISNLLAESLNEQTKILDIGGNRGQTVKFFRKLFPNAQIISFEPIPNLAQKIRALRDSNLVVHQIALSNITGRSTFYESRLDETSSLNPPNLDSTWHRFRSSVLGVNPTKMFKQIEVQVETLDNLFSNDTKNRFLILKIDVEGSELHVLKGALDLLAKKSFDLIQLERHQDDLRKDDFPDIQNLLFSFGYQHVKTLKHPFGNFSEEIFQV
jgi:FkbM family methyltransferase